MALPLLIAIFALFNQQCVNAEWTTPNDGKFFYTKLNKKEGQSYIKLGIGSDNEEVSMMLNTEELTLGVFSTNCSIPYSGYKCDVPDPYDPRDDVQRESNSSQLTYERAYLFDINDGGLKAVDMSGIEAATTVNVTLPQFDCQYNFTGHMFEVIQINQRYTSKIASGYVGLAPYPAVENNQGTTQQVSLAENFLWALHDDGHIDHQIVSIYMDKDNETNSFVKFGGYDPQGFQDLNQTIIIDTLTKDSWTFQGYSTSIFGKIHSSTGFEYNTFIIEPAFPLIYLPVNLYRQFKNQMSRVLPIENSSYTNSRLMIQESCDQVRKRNYDFEFLALVGKFGATKQISLVLDDLLISSEYIDPQESGGCLIGLYPSDGAKDPSSIYLGQMFLQKYYTYFDMSGYYNNETDVMRIGTGLRNKNARILDGQYVPDQHGSRMKKLDQMQCLDQKHDPDHPDHHPDHPDHHPDQDDKVANSDAQESGSSNTTIIIIIVSSVVLVIALGAIFYCKYKKGKNVNDDTPIGENLKKDKTSLNPDRTISEDQNLQLLDQNGMEN